MPESKMTDSAIKTHGKPLNVLKKLNASKWTKGKSEILVNFLNTYKDLPIVAHNVDYDRDKVLKPAFAMVDNSSKLPSDERWGCTWKMAQDLYHDKNYSLDDVLVHFGY